MEVGIKILSDMTKKDLERLSTLVYPTDNGMTIPLINGSDRMRKARITRKHNGTISQSGNNMFSPKETKVSPLIVIIKKE
tara:strand:- start:86 stop:325 length:240 start_codon:yes stop_codon:yes gene_type:complete